MCRARTRARGFEAESRQIDRLDSVQLGRLNEQLRGKPLTFVAAVFIVRLTSKIKEALLRARILVRHLSIGLITL